MKRTLERELNSTQYVKLLKEKRLQPDLHIADHLGFSSALSCIQVLLACLGNIVSVGGLLFFVTCLAKTKRLISSPTPISATFGNPCGRNRGAYRLRIPQWGPPDFSAASLGHHSRGPDQLFFFETSKPLECLTTLVRSELAPDGAYHRFVYGQFFVGLHHALEPKGPSGTSTELLFVFPVDVDAMSSSPQYLIFLVPFGAVMYITYLRLWQSGDTSPSPW